MPFKKAAFDKTGFRAYFFKVYGLSIMNEYGLKFKKPFDLRDE